MAECNQKDINEIIRVFRAYFKTQLKKNLKFPVKCHFCETLLNKEKAFYQYTTIDKWNLIQTDLFQFLKTNSEKPTNESLWNIFGTELTNEPVFFVCENCLPISELNLKFSTIFYDGAPQNFKTGAIKFIFKKGSPDIHLKFFLKITEILKNPEEKHQKNIWEAMRSSIGLLINLNNISTYLTEWMTIIENKNPHSNIAVNQLSTIGLLIPKTDCKQFSRCLSQLSKQEISEIFHNMAKREKFENWYGLLEYLDIKMKKIAFLKIIQNHNTKILEKLFENYANYPISFQNYLFEEIQSLDDIKLWKNLIGKIPPEDLKKLNPKIQEKLQTIFDNYKKEKSEVKNLYNIYFKRKQDKYDKNKIIPFRKVALLLTQGYRKRIDQHIKTYQDEFISFFKLYPDSLLGFDIEEIVGNMICVMGIKIEPDLSIQVTTNVVNDIYSLKKSSPKLQNKFAEWIKTQDSKWVITHGFNSKEYKLAKKSGSLYINSVKFLSNILKNQKFGDSILLDVGLRHFEQYINFKRIGCGIIKHRTRFDLFFNQFSVSLDRHLCKEPQRQCNLCGKTQDVLLYCLEDAFVSILIVVWCVNRGLIPKNQEKFFKK